MEKDDEVEGSNNSLDFGARIYDPRVFCKSTKSYTIPCAQGASEPNNSITNGSSQCIYLNVYPKSGLYRNPESYISSFLRPAAYIELHPKFGISNFKFLPPSYGNKVKDSGGWSLFLAAGFELRVKQIAFGCNVQVGVSANLSDNQTDALLRGMCHVSYLF